MPFFFHHSQNVKIYFLSRNLTTIALTQKKKKKNRKKEKETKYFQSSFGFLGMEGHSTRRVVHGYFSGELTDIYRNTT